MNDHRIAWLQSMPVFGGLKDETVALLLDLAKSQDRAEGEYFCREKERGASMFALQTGQVAVIKTWEERDYLIAELGRGDCFGEMSLIDLGPRSASVLAMEPCSALEISVADLQKLYKHDVSEFAMIHMNMGREVSRRLRDTDRTLFQARVEARTIAGHRIFRRP